MTESINFMSTITFGLKKLSILCLHNYLRTLNRHYCVSGPLTGVIEIGIKTRTERYGLRLMKMWMITEWTGKIKSYIGKVLPRTIVKMWMITECVGKIQSYIGKVLPRTVVKMWVITEWVGKITSYIGKVLPRTFGAPGILDGPRF